MDWTVLTVGVLTAVSALGGIWLGHRLTIKRVKYVEERQLHLKRRDASAAVTEIIAEWVRSSYTGKSSNEDRWRLQTTYWKNILWLEKGLLDLLLPTLAYKESAVSTNELIVQTRKVLLGLQEPDISADQLNNWLPENESSKAEASDGS